MADCEVYIVAVPTPVDDSNRPDISNLISASKLVGKVLSSANTVIYESTVYPGATEEICVPVLEEVSGLGSAWFFVGYSPERINPGDKQHTLRDIVKVTSDRLKKRLDLSTLYMDQLCRPEHTLAAASKRQSRKGN